MDKPSQLPSNGLTNTLAVNELTGMHVNSFPLVSSSGLVPDEILVSSEHSSCTVSPNSVLIWSDESTGWEWKTEEAQDDAIQEKIQEIQIHGYTKKGKCTPQQCYE